MTKNNKETCAKNEQTYKDIIFSTTKCCPKGKKIQTLAKTDEKLNTGMQACCSETETAYLNLYNFGFAEALEAAQSMIQSKLSEMKQVLDLGDNITPSNKSNYQNEYNDALAQIQPFQEEIASTIDILPSYLACCPANQKVIYFESKLLANAGYQAGLCCDKKHTKIAVLDGVLQCQ